MRTWVLPGFAHLLPGRFRLLPSVGSPLSSGVQHGAVVRTPSSARGALLWEGLQASLAVKGHTVRGRASMHCRHLRRIQVIVLAALFVFSSSAKQTHHLTLGGGACSSIEFNGLGPSFHYTAHLARVEGNSTCIR